MATGANTKRRRAVSTETTETPLVSNSTAASPCESQALDELAEALKLRDPCPGVHTDVDAHARFLNEISMEEPVPLDDPPSSPPITVLRAPRPGAYDAIGCAACAERDAIIAALKHQLFLAHREKLQLITENARLEARGAKRAARSQLYE